MKWFLASCLVWCAPLAAQDSPVPAAPATGHQWPSLPDIGDTSRMDPEVVELVQAQRAEVEQAIADESLQGEEKATAVGMALTRLGLAFEANTMWTPARDVYQGAFDTLPGEGSHRDQWLYRVAVCEHALGHADRAAKLLTDIAPKLSGTAIVQARLGQARYDLGHLEQAEAAWRNAIAAEQIMWEKADPEQRSQKPIPIPASRVGLAVVLWELDRLDEAKTLLQEALALQPHYPHAHYLLGQILAEQGKEAEAQFQLTRGRGAYPVLPPDPHSPLLVQMRAGFGNRMRNIEISMQEGRLPEALTELEAMMVERPEDVMVLNLAARAHTMMGRLDRSLELLQKSETIDPTHYQTKNQLALTYLNLIGQSSSQEQMVERMNLARAKATEAVELAPHLGTAWFYRGLTELAGINPQDPNAGQALQAVLTMFQRAHLLGCQEPQLFERMTMLYAQTGRTREMLTFAKQGTIQNPENPGAWVLLARAHLTLGNQQEALRAGDRAIAVAPNNPDVQAFVQNLKQTIQSSGQ